MVETDDRCVNVPSYSLPISMIIEVSTTAEEEKRSQSSILKEALAEWFGRRAIKKSKN